jgi:hypothetical protein
MHLKEGNSKEIVSSNISELVRSGIEPKQAVAAALANARKFKWEESEPAPRAENPEASDATPFGAELAKAIQSDTTWTK